MNHEQRFMEALKEWSTPMGRLCLVKHHVDRRLTEEAPSEVMSRLKAILIFTSRMLEDVGRRYQDGKLRQDLFHAALSFIASPYAEVWEYDNLEEVAWRAEYVRSGKLYYHLRRQANLLNRPKH